MTKTNNQSLSALPERITAGNVVYRLIDSLEFRFYWVTEGLEGDIYAFKPCEDCRNISELQVHIWDLLNWAYSEIKGAGLERPTGDTAFRAGILELCGGLKGLFLDMENKGLEEIRIMGLPFWVLLNGPLADALTHVGQIGTVRRIAGSPAPVSDPFQGTPPAGN